MLRYCACESHSTLNSRVFKGVTKIKIVYMRCEDMKYLVCPSHFVWLLWAYFCFYSLCHILPLFFPAMLTVPSAYLSPTARTRISITNLLCLVLFYTRH